MKTPRAHAPPTPPTLEAAVLCREPAPGNAQHQMAALAQVLAAIAIRLSTNRVQSGRSK